MDHSGTRLLAASRPAIWQHLTSAQSLALCIPGCERVTGTMADGFEMAVGHKVGPFTLHFTGTIELCDVIPARSVTLTGRGKGAIAGLAQGSARIRLSDHPDGAEIAWDLGALIDGRVARLGRKPLDGAVSAMTEHFIDRLDALLQAETGSRSG